MYSMLNSLGMWICHRRGKGKEQQDDMIRPNVELIDVPVEMVLIREMRGGNRRISGIPGYRL